MLRYLGSEIDELEKVSFATVHIRDKSGERTTQWKIGEDVTFKDFLAARDPGSGDLHAVIERVSGNDKTRLCGKDEWHKLGYDTEEEVRTRDDQIIEVHILDPRGNYSTTWRIGEDVSAEVAQQARDVQSNALYAMVTLEDGKASTHVLKKHLWLRAKEQFDSIDRQGEEAMARTRKAHPELFERTNDPERDSDASRAPIGRILPSFVPVILERGLPGYAAEALTAGEIRVPMQQLRPLLVAATLVGAWDYAGSQGFDSDAVRELLVQSLHNIPDLMPYEAKATVDLVDRFLSFNVIRSEHPLDDWLCEAMWPAFQVAPYRYPSAMSNVLSYGLGIRDALRKTTLEY
jgi:hypothetical protein